MEFLCCYVRGLKLAWFNLTNKLPSMAKLAKYLAINGFDNLRLGIPVRLGLREKTHLTPIVELQ